MDLILLDENFKKIKPLTDFVSFDGVVGLKSFSENDFELKVPYHKKNLFKKGQFVAWGTSEFGGIIKRREINTDKGEFTYSGYSLRGFWQRNNKSVDDLTVNGTVVDHLSVFIGWDDVSLIDYVDFVNNIGDATLSLTYEGATALLHCIDRAARNFNATIDITIVNQRIRIEINPIQTHRFDDSQVDLIFEENWEAPTTVYCVNNNLDIGVSAHLQPDGTINRDIYYTGLEKIQKVVTSDLTTEDELYAQAESELQQNREFTSSEIFVDVERANVGDKVKASISEIGVSVERRIVEKRLTIKNKNEEITYTLEG